MQDGSFVKPRDDKPAVSEALPWSRGQLSEAGKEPVVVNRAKSMRRRLLLVGEKWRWMLRRPCERKGQGKAGGVNQTRAELVADGDGEVLGGPRGSGFQPASGRASG
jgi:hypothetical protein